MIDIGGQLTNCISLAEEAKRMGCDRAGLIWAEDVVFDPRVALKCRQNICSHYGRNFMCPPHAPAAGDFRQSAQKFRIALLLQREREMLPGSTPGDIDKEFGELGRDIRQILVSLEKKAFDCGFVFSTGLGSGECKLCKTCGKILGSESCHNPQEARPSMEAVGIDVLGTCRKAGFPDLFQKGRLTVTGLLFIT